MPSDRVRKKLTNYREIVGEKCVDYAENTLDYAEISTFNKIDDLNGTTVKRKHFKDLQFNRIIECTSYWPTLTYA